MFWERERRIKSFVTEQLMGFVRGREESQPDLGMMVNISRLSTCGKGAYPM